MAQTDDGLADFLLDNYGYCKCGAKCRCLQMGWLGRKCPDWKPFGPTTYEELEAEDRKVYDYLRK